MCVKTFIWMFLGTQRQTTFKCLLFRPSPNDQFLYPSFSLAGYMSDWPDVQISNGTHKCCSLEGCRIITYFKQPVKVI